MTFNGFLLAAQQETRAGDSSSSGRADNSDVSVDVYLMNEQKITVRGPNILQTEEVLLVRTDVLLFFSML